MLEQLEKQKEIYFNNLLYSIQEEDKQHWLQLLNEVLSEMIELKYCT